MKPSARAASLRSWTSSFRSASTTGPTSLLASQTACPPRRVVGLLEDLADLAVGHFLAVDPGAVDVERLLDGVRLRGDLLQQRRVDLLLQVDQVEHVDLAARIGSSRLLSFDGLELREPTAVGERGVEPVLGFLLGGEILVLAGDVGVPPRQGGGPLQRPDFLLVGLDELLCPHGGISVQTGPLGRVRESTGTDHIRRTDQEIASRRHLDLSCFRARGRGVVIVSGLACECKPDEGEGRPLHEAAIRASSVARTRRLAALHLCSWPFGFRMESGEPAADGTWGDSWNLPPASEFGTPGLSLGWHLQDGVRRFRRDATRHGDRPSSFPSAIQ